MHFSNVLALAATLIGAAVPASAGCSMPGSVGLGDGFELTSRGDSCLNNGQGNDNIPRWPLDQNHIDSFVGDFQWHWHHSSNSDLTLDSCIAWRKFGRSGWMAWITMALTDGWTMQSISEGNSRSIISNFLGRRRDSGEPMQFRMDIKKNGRPVGYVAFDGYNKAADVDLRRCTVVGGDS